MRRFLSWGVLVLFLAGLLAGAVGCASDNSKSSKKSTYKEKREGSGNGY